MPNKLTDLNNHLFCQLERLNDDDLSVESLKNEAMRAAAMCKLAETIISIDRLILDAAKTVDQATGKIELPLLLSDGNKA
jgi:hypothetical protein